MFFNNYLLKKFNNIGYNFNKNENIDSLLLLINDELINCYKKADRFLKERKLNKLYKLKQNYIY